MKNNNYDYYIEYAFTLPSNEVYIRRSNAFIVWTRTTGLLVLIVKNFGFCYSNIVQPYYYISSMSTNKNKLRHYRWHNSFIYERNNSKKLYFNIWAPLVTQKTNAMCFVGLIH